MKTGRGFSLIEVIALIVILSIAAVALLSALGRSLPRGATAAQITQATQLAQERMDYILGQKAVQGFSGNLETGCPAAICTAPSGFTVTSTGATAAVACPAAIDPSTSTCRQITVTVTGPGGIQLAQLVSLITNH